MTKKQQEYEEHRNGKTQKTRQTYDRKIKQEMDGEKEKEKKKQNRNNNLKNE